ncbi:Transmembrane protein 88B [Myotis brandtii]|uniref:Transmembrane protein 88B n=1 Tax=Myotis brandtii TaxID=109478 RepID=S7QGS8_MYOBR|nr:Transmembrane protein 88B [Myotis brandtii]
MSEQERETEEDEGGGPSDMAPMLPRRRPDHRAGPSALGLPGRMLAGLLLHLLLPGTVFLLVLMPAAAIIYLGFLCHSRVSWALRGSWGTHWLGLPGSGVLRKLRALGLRVNRPPCRQRHVCPSPESPSPASPSPTGHSRRAFVPTMGTALSLP